MFLREFTNATQQNSTGSNPELLSHRLADCEYFLCEVGFLPHSVSDKMITILLALSQKQGHVGDGL